MTNTFTDDIRQTWIPRYGAVAVLIVLNVGVYIVLTVSGLLAFFMGLWKPFDGVLNYLRLPSNLTELLWRPWTVFTHAVFHHPADVLHILFNMLWLFWMGRIFRDYHGDRQVYGVFLYGVLAGAVVYLLAYNLLPVFSSQLAYLNGASAGVSALIVAAATWAPNHTVFTLLGPIRLKWIALILVLLDLALIPQSNPGGRLAHIGGVVLGFVFARQLAAGVDWSAPLAFLTQERSDRSTRSLRVSHRSKPAPLTPQQEIDRLLDKIAAVGYDKLTAEEKKRLHDAGSGDLRL